MVVVVDIDLVDQSGFLRADIDLDGRREIAGRGDRHIEVVPFDRRGRILNRRRRPEAAREQQQRR